VPVAADEAPPSVPCIGHRHLHHLGRWLRSKPRDGSPPFTNSTGAVGRFYTQVSCIGPGSAPRLRTIQSAAAWREAAHGHLLDLREAANDIDQRTKGVNRQDFPINTSIQKGYSSRFAARGRYSNQELVLVQINRWLVKRYREC
jgi:hypothetical protein